jgi:hypothetical protein
MKALERVIFHLGADTINGLKAQPRWRWCVVKGMLLDIQTRGPDNIGLTEKRNDVSSLPALDLSLKRYNWNYGPIQIHVAKSTETLSVSIFADILSHLDDDRPSGGGAARIRALAASITLRSVVVALNKMKIDSQNLWDINPTRLRKNHSEWTVQSNISLHPIREIGHQRSVALTQNLRLLENTLGRPISTRISGAKFRALEEIESDLPRTMFMRHLELIKPSRLNAATRGKPIKPVRSIESNSVGQRLIPMLWARKGILVSQRTKVGDSECRSKRFHDAVDTYNFIGNSRRELEPSMDH